MLEIYFTHFKKILQPHVHVTGGEQLSFNLELNPEPLAFPASALTIDLQRLKMFTHSKNTSVNSVTCYHFFRNLPQNSRCTGNAVKHVPGGVTVGFVLYRALSVMWIKVKSQPGLSDSNPGPRTIKVRRPYFWSQYHFCTKYSFCKSESEIKDELI